MNSATMVIQKEVLAQELSTCHGGRVKWDDGASARIWLRTGAWQQWCCQEMACKAVAVAAGMCATGTQCPH